MKDSQDWLELTIDETLRNRVKFIGDNEWSMIGYPNEVIQELKSAIRKHILQEALEMIGEDDRDYSGDNTDHDSKIFLVAASTACNELRQELRNKFNDKYKED